MLYQSTCVGLGYGHKRWGYFLEPLHRTINPIRPYDTRDPSLSTRPTIINVVPIDYAFRPRLRGRLTLRGLALRRNPWIFGVRVSHPHLATHVSILTSDTSSSPHGPPSQAYGTLRYHPTEVGSAASVHVLSPGTSSAQDSLDLDQ